MILKKAISCNIIHGFNTIVHFALGVLIAYYFGASEKMDAYVAASNFILALNALLINSQNSTFIPFISKYENHPDRSKIFDSIYKANLAFFFMASLLIFFVAGILPSLIAPGLDPGQRIIAANTIKILAFFLFFADISSIGFNLLDYNYKFEKKYLLMLFSTIIIMLFIIFLKHSLGVYSMALAYSSGGAITFIISLFVIKNFKKKENNSFPFFNVFIKKYLLLLLPVIISWLFVFLLRFSDTFIASFLGKGTISHLNYCQKINIYSASIVSIIASIYFPVLSRLAGKNDKEYLIYFYKGLQTVMLISLCIAGYIFIFSRPLIQILFERGSFSPEDTTKVATAMKFFILVLAISGSGTYLLNTYYSFRKTKLATIFAAASATVNIILNIVLGRIMGLNGLALASSIAILTGGVLQIYNIKRLIGSYSLRKVVLIIKDPAVSLITATLAAHLFSYSFGSALSPIFNVVAGGFIYFTLFLSVCFILRVEVVMIFLRKIKTYLNRNTDSAV